MAEDPPPLPPPPIPSSPPPAALSQSRRTLLPVIIGLAALILALVWAIVRSGHVGDFAKDFKQGFEQGFEKGRQGPNHDDEEIAAMQARIAELQRRMIESTDLTEVAGFQAQMRQEMDDILPKLSPDTRTGMIIGIKIVHPLLADAEAYSRSVADFSSTGAADFTTAKSQDDILARIATIADLDAANDGLIARFNSLDADAQKIVAAEKLSAVQQRALLEGFRKGIKPRIGPVGTIRALDTRIFEQYRIGYQQLHDAWGRWRVLEEGGIEWDDATEEETFTTTVTLLQSLGEEQIAAQHELLPAGP